MNIQDTHEIKNNNFNNYFPKLIFYYEVRQESYILLFEKGRKQIRNKSKNNEYMSNFIFSSKTQKKNTRVQN